VHDAVEGVKSKLHPHKAGEGVQPDYTDKKFEYEHSDKWIGEDLDKALHGKGGKFGTLPLAEGNDHRTGTVDHNDKGHPFN